MNKFVRKHLKEIIVTIVSVLSVILISCALLLINNFSNGLYKQAVDAVDHHVEEYQKMLDGVFQIYINKGEEIASGFPESINSISDYMSLLKNDPKYNEVAYITFFTQDGEARDADYPIGGSVSYNSKLEKFIRSNSSGTIGLYDEAVSSVRLMGVYAPVNRGEVRGIAVLYHAKPFLDTLKSEYENNFFSDTPANYVYICKYPDEIISVLDPGKTPLTNNDMTEHDSFKSYLRGITDKTTVDLFEQSLIASGISHEVLVNGTRYVVSVKPSTLVGSENFVIAFYNSYNVYAEGHALASVLGAIIVVIVIIIIGLAAYILLVRFKLAKQVDTYDLEDADYGCPNFRAYSVKSEELLTKNKVTKYAVIYTEIAHFSYIEETYGAKAADETIRFLLKVYENALQMDETFGRVNDDRFVLLFHYKTEEDLMARLKNITSLSYHCPALTKYGFYLRLIIGVCAINREDDFDGVQKYVDRAMVARRTNLGDQSNVHVYSEKVHETFMMEAEIESKMEAALRNNEFKMFYQPKYNIERNRPDGCEALVRWYDAENNRFRPPSEFLPLFETNGFIAELDKYVMNEVCKFIAESLSRGYRMIPVSVNVSRVTASKEGFFEYYIATKKKYGIRDKFMTIEFTESFTYENYEVISNIVNKFHANGFECSIDDFGSGFSSYNILKELPMDEIKLDRFFIKPGISRERDDKLLISIINLSKQMNMKVTQEGVETVEDLKRLKDFGCDVVQGYIYAKPMAATDFLEFIRSGGSIHIV